MSLASLIPRLSVGWPGTRLVLAYRLLMSCVSEPDYKEEQSSELETLRCIYTDEELTGTHTVLLGCRQLLLSSSIGAMFLSPHRNIRRPYLL